MIQELNKVFWGIIRIIICKIIYFKQISFCSIPKICCNFSIFLRKEVRLQIEKNFKGRDNISFRIQERGIVEIGDNCFFNSNCSINCRKKIIMGNNVLLGQNVVIIDHDHDYKGNINNFIKSDIEIGDNVWIGANSIILRGVTIGNNVVVAADTIVRENIEDNVMIYQERKNVIKKIKSN